MVVLGAEEEAELCGGQVPSFIKVCEVCWCGGL